MASPTTVQVTPPDWLSTFMPRLYEATSVPSAVASGIRNSPFACSPLTWSGPASPIGTWATPTKLSIFPRVTAGSKE